MVAQLKDNLTGMLRLLPLQQEDNGGSVRSRRVDASRPGMGGDATGYNGTMADGADGGLS